MKPLLSIVATSRNDEHGGHLLARMQLFVEGLSEQAGRFRLPVELVLVEWNPPPDRPPLVEALHWAPNEYFLSRVLTVPSDVHQTFPHADGLPLFQMIGKNVGIRRSTAPYVLATNIDILLSDELFAFFGTGLKPNAMYRVDRHDVLAELAGARLPSPGECRALPVLRVHGIDGLRYPNGRPPVGAAPPSLRGVKPAVSELARVVAAARDRVVLPKLHTSGSGDFTLTSRDVWFGIHGYPEWPAYSWHMDGVAMFQAYAAGVDMVNLKPPMIAYHLEHGEGSGWTPESSRLFERLDAAGVPYLSTPAYRSLARRLAHGTRGFHPLNGEDWGLAERELLTTEVSPPAARPKPDPSSNR